EVPMKGIHARTIESRSRATADWLPMAVTARASMTPAGFDQREQFRRSRFAQTWRELIPKLFEDVPQYYRLGNVIASFGLWELWVSQFVRTIRLQPGYKALDVCAGTNDVGIRLLRKQPGLAVTAIDRSAEMQAQGQKRA